MTHLTCTEGGANKFWEGTVDGSTLTVRFGKIGTDGQTKATKFAGAAEAEKELAKLIKQKLAKGYVETTSAAPASAGNASDQNPLAATLKELDPLWKKKLPQVVSSLRPGIDASKHEGLARILAGKKLPADLETWFAWHDGQNPGAPNVCDDNNYVMHSLDSACETWTLLKDNAEDIEGPVDSNWLPLLENGAGDHQVYDLKTGALLSFFHDEEERPREHASLLVWAKVMVTALEKIAPQKKATFRVNDLAWKKVAKAPANVATCSPGTMFHYPMKLAMGDRHEVTIKLTADKWLHGSGLEFEGALAQLAKHLDAPPAKGSGYWKGDGSTAYDLQTYARGLRQAQAD
jgi:predicted DNA-binding WGR domain protein/cell wall assembly regulator SMI1